MLETVVKLKQLLLRLEPGTVIDEIIREANSLVKLALKEETQTLTGLAELNTAYVLIMEKLPPLQQNRMSELGRLK